jgi:3'-phosphoadenosine 5'-phosphosulfate sulfotransferase (PAPS reductase)/FAD synthetase
MCSISGGADSDCMLELIYSVDKYKKVDYIWFETGLAYQAEKEQLKYLEDKYGVEIKHYKAIKPIPLTCRTIGQPFISKRVSNEIARGQRYNFQWEDEPLDVLLEKYPKCKQFLRWWCNDWEGGSSSNFNIDHNKGLKQFMIANPPWFKISDSCCHYAKKEVGLRCYKSGGYDLSLYGVRKAEGGTRATAYTNCFTDKTSKGTTEYRPLYWWKDSDKKEFEERFSIVHSKCYTEMGLPRTGCPACPYGRDFERELSILKQWEPQMYIAVNNIFKDSYEYTRMYREFQKNISNTLLN